MKIQKIYFGWHNTKWYCIIFDWVHTRHAEFEFPVWNWFILWLLRAILFCLPLSVDINTTIYSSICQSIHPSIHLPTNPSIHPSTHPSIHPSHDPSHDASSQSHYIHPMNQPSINPWIHPRINQSSDLQLCLSSLIMSFLVGAALLNHPFCLFVWWHIIPPFLLDGCLKKYYIELSPVLSREGKAGPCMLAILLIFFYSQWQIFCRGFLLVLPSSSKAMTPNLKLVTVIVTLNIFWLNSQERPFV